MSPKKELEKLESSLGGYKSQVETVFRGNLIWAKDLIFLGRTQKGYEIEFDANVQWGCQPSEPLMLSLAGCIATDCVMFLQKMKVKLENFKVDITGFKPENPPHYFKRFDVILHITGKNLTEKKVQRAIKLSQEKYCGVSHTMRKDMEINIDYKLNEEAEVTKIEMDIP